MFFTHPKLEDLEGLLCGTSRSASPASKSLVVRHLLSDCPICRERLITLHRDSPRLAQLLRSEGEEPAGTAAMRSPDAYDYGNAFSAAARAVFALLAPEDQGAGSPPDVLAELDALPADERVRRVSTGGPFANPALIDVLINRSHEARYRDADEMLHFATLARLAADRCSPADEGNGLRLADLQARAWGQYGNALRVSGKPREAEEAFATAQR